MAHSPPATPSPRGPNASAFRDLSRQGSTKLGQGGDNGGGAAEGTLRAAVKNGGSGAPGAAAPFPGGDGWLKTSGRTLSGTQKPCWAGSCWRGTTGDGTGNTATVGGGQGSFQLRRPPARREVAGDWCCPRVAGLRDVNVKEILSSWSRSWCPGYGCLDAGLRLPGRSVHLLPPALPRVV